MLSISNIKWDHKDFLDIPALSTALTTRLKKLNLVVKISNKENVITFNDIEGRTIISAVKNRSTKKPSAKHKETTHRDYLLTNRPTQEQHEGFFNVIQNTLDALNLQADITL